MAMPALPMGIIEGLDNAGATAWLPQNHVGRFFKKCRFPDPILDPLGLDLPPGVGWDVSILQFPGARAMHSQAWKPLALGSETGAGMTTEGQQSKPEAGIPKEPRPSSSAGTPDAHTWPPDWRAAESVAAPSGVTLRRGGPPSSRMPLSFLPTSSRLFLPAPTQIPLSPHP